jgi:hypothetical protein
MSPLSLMGHYLIFWLGESKVNSLGQRFFVAAEEEVLSREAAL